MEDSIGIETGQSTQHFFFGFKSISGSELVGGGLNFSDIRAGSWRAGLPGEASRGLIREYAAWRRDGNRHRLGCRTAATRRANRDSPLVQDHRVPPKVEVAGVGPGQWAQPVPKSSDAAIGHVRQDKPRIQAAQSSRRSLGCRRTSPP